MLVASLCFATMGLFIKLASAEGASIGDVIFFRGLVPAIAIATWAILTHRSLKSPVANLHMRRNVFGIAAMWLGFYATTQLPLATAVTLMYTSPLFIALILRFYYQQKNSRIESLTIGLGFLGVIAILKPVLNTQDLWVALGGLAGGAIAALAYLQLRELGKMEEPEWRTVLYFAGTATLSGLAAYVLFPADLIWLQNPLSLGILYLTGIGVFGGVGNLALTRSFGSGSTWLSASLQYSTILISTLYGVLVFGNIPSQSTWLGVFLITGCGVVSSLATHLKSKKC